MAQSKSKSSKKPSKKPAAPATAKKVKRTASVDTTPTPAPIFTDAAPVMAEVAVAPEAVVAAAPARLISHAEFLELVRKEAYRRAAHRSFKNGSPFQDWVNAEAAVSGKLAAEGVRLS